MIGDTGNIVVTTSKYFIQNRHTSIAFDDVEIEPSTIKISLSQNFIKMCIRDRYHRVYDYANPVVNTDGTITYPMIEDKRLPTSESVPLPPGVTMWDGLDAYTRRFYYEFSVAYNRSFNDHNVRCV